MTDEQTSQAKINAYLKRLGDSLGSLPPGEASDILQEIRSHIEERRVELGGADDRTAERILAQLGRPEDIGALYQTDALVARARASFSPLLIVLTTLRLATKTALGLIAFLLGFFGYGLGLGLVVCAVLKPFFPQNIGLFVGARGVNLAAVPAPDRADELLGWWVIPIDLLVGVLAVLGTTMFLRWMLRFARSPWSRGAPAHPPAQDGPWRLLICLALVGLIMASLVWGLRPG
jgi:hypothetical protein